MVEQMDKEGFGHCTWHGECAEACPKGIPLTSIAATAESAAIESGCNDACPGANSRLAFSWWYGFAVPNRGGFMNT